MKTDLSLASQEAKEAALAAVLVYKESKGSTESLPSVEAAFARLVEESNPLNKVVLGGRLLALLHKAVAFHCNRTVVKLVFSEDAPAGELYRLITQFVTPPAEETWVVMYNDRYYSYDCPLWVRSNDIPGQFASEAEAAAAIAENARRRSQTASRWKAVRRDVP